VTTLLTHSLSEVVATSGPIPEGKLAYLQERQRNNLYSFILKKFLERGISKADLARRINYDPARITRLLGAPGNWTLDTISDLLVGVAGEELVPASRSLQNISPQNYMPEWLRPPEDTQLRPLREQPPRADSFLQKKDRPRPDSGILDRAA